MLRKQIEKWFASEGSYLEGVALYRQAGGSYPVRTFEGFEQARFVPDRIDTMLRAGLMAYLEKTDAGDVADKPLKEETIFFTPSENVPAGTPLVPDEPDDILRLRMEARLLHKRQALLHARLHEAVDDATRYEHACEIMQEVIPALDAIYDNIRHWQATGEIPAAAAPDADVVAQTVQKMLKRGTLTSRISRLKGFLKGKLTDIERQEYEKELLQKEVEKKELDQELGLEKE